MGCKAWYLCPNQIAWIQGWFSGGDVSVTIVSVLFCSESRFHSGHLHALIPAANSTTLFFLEKKQQAAGISMFVRRGRSPVCLDCMFWGVSSLNACTLYVQNWIVVKLGVFKEWYKQWFQIRAANQQKLYYVCIHAKCYKYVALSFDCIPVSIWKINKTKIYLKWTTTHSFYLYAAVFVQTLICMHMHGALFVCLCWLISYYVCDCCCESVIRVLAEMLTAGSFWPLKGQTLAWISGTKSAAA